MKAIAHVERDANEFPIQVEAGGRLLPTEAKRAADVHMMAREVVALVFDIDGDEVDLDVCWPVEVETLQARLDTARRGLEEAEAEMRDARETAARELHDQGWRQRDIATLTGVSKQRISQLMAAMAR